MKAVKSKGTLIEKLIAIELRKQKIKFNRNVKSIYGTPDFVLKDLKMVVFCDSEFFHGKDWKKRRFNIKSKRDFWWKKIEGNIARDRKVTRELRSQGWVVQRFWDSQIKKNPSKCVELILKKGCNYGKKGCKEKK
jgi:DNA mismatch endonuclease (patch repair protein)